MNILATLVSDDAGEVRVAGHDVARDPDSVRDVIGLAGQFSAVDDLLTGRENFVLMADLLAAIAGDDFDHSRPAPAAGAATRSVLPSKGAEIFGLSS